MCVARLAAGLAEVQLTPTSLARPTSAARARRPLALRRTKDRKPQITPEAEIGETNKWINLRLYPFLCNYQSLFLNRLVLTDEEIKLKGRGIHFFLMDLGIAVFNRLKFFTWIAKGEVMAILVRISFYAVFSHGKPSCLFSRKVTLQEEKYYSMTRYQKPNKTCAWRIASVIHVG